jgi:hypothetical protein
MAGCHPVLGALLEVELETAAQDPFTLAPLRLFQHHDALGQACDHHDAVFGEHVEAAAASAGPWWLPDWKMTQACPGRASGNPASAPNWPREHVRKESPSMRI